MMQPAEASPEGSHIHKCIVGNSDIEPYLPAMHSMCSSSETSAEARVAAASNNHKEAEKRRRQRINSHLDTLRTLLPPCNSRTDKASLLAKVVEQVKELKQQSSHMQLESSFPSDTDDVIVVTEFLFNKDHQSLVIKASFCCDDRSDLITELIQTLKSLRLSPLKAEMVTFGGRTRNVLILSMDKIEEKNEVVEFLRQELRSLVHRSTSYLGDRFKRQRRIINSIQ